MANLITDIKSGKLAPIYLFYGEEAYKKRLYKEALLKSVTNGDMMNYSAFEGKSIDWQAVLDASLTMPFFADKRLVIIENSGKFKASASKDADASAKSATRKSAESSAGKADALIERIISESPETTCIAFFEDSAAKNKRIYKQIAAKGVVCECNADTEEDLVNWLARGFASNGKKVRKSTLSFLIGRVGLNYDKLRMEVEKILSYVGDKEVVDDADVLAISSETTESKIFELLGAMSEKNVTGVLERYHELLANKEHPLYIMAMLRSQLRTMLQTAELSDKGMNAYDIARTAGKPQFVVKKTLGYLRYFKKEQIIRMMDEINEIDKRSKSGMITDQLGVELLLIEFSG